MLRYLSSCSFALFAQSEASLRLERGKEKKKIVYLGALAWPLPIYLSALVVRAMFAS